MAPPQTDRDAIRSLLAMVRGVESVEVTGSNGDVESLQIAVADRGSTGRVVRDIESALASGLGLEIDHDRIHIVPDEASGYADPFAELGLERPATYDPAHAPARSPRLRLVEVRTEESADSPHCEVAVTVALAEARVTGRMRDADTPRGRVLSSARAALLAVEETISGRTAFLMDGIEEFTIGDLPGLIASVRARQDRDTRTMYGCALVDTHPSEAAAKAALDAVNRFWDAQERAPVDDSDDTGKETR